MDLSLKIYIFFIINFELKHLKLFSSTKTLKNKKFYFSDHMIWETQTFLRMFLYLFFESQDGFGSLKGSCCSEPYFLDSEDC